MQNKTSVFIARQNDCKLLKLMYVGKSGGMEIRFSNFKRVPDLGSLINQITLYSPHFCIPVKLRKRIYLYK